jgi:hypothetical protein
MISCVLSTFFLDLNKLNGIASKNKWVQSDWDLKNTQDEVIIVTDCTVKIVFASHNIVNMNGYHEEEVLGKVLKCFKVRLQMVLPLVKFVRLF